MSPRRVALVVALPLLAVGAGVLYAERTFAGSRDFTFEITGYDPRDVLRGHYLEFQLQLAPLAADHCHTSGTGCCPCLTQSSDFELARIERTPCEAARRCDGWLDPAAATQAYRLYVPDTRAAALERTLMDAVVRRTAHARVAIDAKGQARVRTLLVDGRPILGER